MSHDLVDRALKEAIASALARGVRPEDIRILYNDIEWRWSTVGHRWEWYDRAAAGELAPTRAPEEPP